MTNVKFMKFNEISVKKVVLQRIPQLKKMAQLNFGGVLENVVTREEFSLEKAKEILKKDKFS